LVPVACSIAGSDSGGGAGIQADLKTFAACGAYGTTVVVALTAQDTTGVSAVETSSLDIIGAQFDAVAGDFQPRAWKTGMLGSADVVELVAARLRALGTARLVVDPVMVSKSGARLLEAAAVERVRRLLVPLATVLTPNLPEAQELTGEVVEDVEGARRAALALAAMGATVVVVKGGHAPGDEVVDVVYEAGRDTFTELRHPRVPGTSTHGTGCTFSAAITAHLARGAAPLDAIRAARAYLQQALLEAPGLGAGHGPLGHHPFAEVAG
jgi:hydroxymethylpyrimidine/phosphomethylpyrimidine kinase